MRRILYIIGLDRNWAIANRARQLATKLSNGFDIEIAAKGQLPADPSGYDIVHLHTPCMIPEIIRNQAYMQHPTWGFEIISARSNASITRYPEVTKRATFCVAKNRRLAEWAEPYLTCSPTWIANGVDERMFYPRPLRVGWCGNKRPDSLEYKGVALIQQAVEALQAEWGKWTRIEFVMDPGDAPQRVISQQELAPWYRSLDVYATASLGEGCSNTVLEALACGVPVVTTDTGIVHELAAGCDVTVVERSMEGVMQGIRAILEPAVERRRLICQQYRWKAVAEQYAKLYQQVCA